MKIALFVPIIDQPGGTEIGTWRLAECLAQRGHQVTIISTQAVSQWQKHLSIFDYTKEFRLVRLPVWQRSRRVFANMLTAQVLWACPMLMRDTQIMHLRGLTVESLALARIAQWNGISTLCVPMASGDYGDVAMFPPNISKNYAAFNWISALTQPLRTEVIDWGFPAHKTGVIPNGININRFKPAEHRINEARVIFVGQFRPEKRIDLLLNAWVQVQTECPHAHLTLVGGGQHIDYYQQMAAKLGLSPTFIPNTDTSQVLTNLQASSIFVMPGISEGMSNALLEAMAVGLAPVVADTPANRAVITPEIDGLCYNSASSEALAIQLRRLITNVELRQHIGEAARQTVVQRFNLETVTEQYLALYAQLLGEKR